ncbi:MAG: glycosyltransferase family 39 protein, partial [Methanomicrobiales archaeon]|nr:glycosyltransferase family 39 protein [Methanomicrobiales archaeon]
MTAVQGKKSSSRKPGKKAPFTPALDTAECQVWARENRNWAYLRACFLRSRYIQVLLLLTVIGGILRFIHLGYNSLWLDEASTLWFAKKTLIGIWESTAGGEFNPPLFHWMEHAMLVFGQSEFVLRFLPAVLGTLTIPVFYLVGKEWFDRNAGLISAALLAFSPFHL